jgi:hypothetical protein
MDVVHQEEIHVGAVAAPELGHGPAVNTLDHLVDELLGTHVEHPGFRVAFNNDVSDGLHQVGLAQPGSSIDEERVIGLAGRLGGGVRRSGGELVGLADDEGVEGIPLVERLSARIELGSGGCGRCRRHEEVHLRTLLPVLVYPEDDRRRVTQNRLGQTREERRVLGLVPLHGELVGRPDDEATLVQGDCLGGLEPRPDGVVGKFAMRLVENALPSVFCGQLHRYSKTEGIFSRARDVTGGVWKSQSGLDRGKRAEKAERTERGRHERKKFTSTSFRPASSPPLPSSPPSA